MVSVLRAAAPVAAELEAAVAPPVEHLLPVAVVCAVVFLARFRFQTTEDEDAEANRVSFPLDVARAFAHRRCNNSARKRRMKRAA